MAEVYHKPVLIKEVIEYLAPEEGKVYVDATFGGGGHTSAILDAAPNCKVISFDWDNNAIKINGPKVKEKYGNRLEIIWGNFAQITNLLKKHNISKVDGILADFGTSQYQIHEQAGFSFHTNTVLDMRMSAAHFSVTAADIINRASEEELATIFYEYGGEFRSRKIAREIVTRRNATPFRYTKELAELVADVYDRMYSKIHPATKVFQALRIVVNQELNNIKSLLAQSINLLNPEGRAVFISFHSLEDRIVKQFFKENKQAFDILTPKVITATEQELKENLSSRSAKLRAGKKKFPLR